MSVGDVRHFHRVLEGDLDTVEPGWIEWARERVPSIPSEAIILLEREGELPLVEEANAVKPVENIGKKDDEGKPQFSQLPPGVIVQVAHVLTDGAKHYGSDDNWKRVRNPRKRYYDAAMRHLDSYWCGESIDPKSGRPHLAHAIADLMFLLWFQINETKEK